MLPEPSAMTVGQYLTAWLGNSIGRSEKILERYSHLARLQIIPHIGAIKI
jgi:hypothetical protein